MGNEFKLKIEQDNSKEIEEKQICEWEIEDAIRTIIRAEEIKNDPKLMAEIGPKLKEKQQAVIKATEVLYGKNEEDKK